LHLNNNYALFEENHLNIKWKLDFQLSRFTLNMQFWFQQTEKLITLCKIQTALLWIGKSNQNFKFYCGLIFNWIWGWSNRIINWKLIVDFILNGSLDEHEKIITLKWGDFFYSTLMESLKFKNIWNNKCKCVLKFSISIIAIYYHVNYQMKILHSIFSWIFIDSYKLLIRFSILIHRGTFLPVNL
jgi:hypothetical protein